MLRIPKGQYVRDTWSWLGSDAIWGFTGKSVIANSTAGAFLQNSSTAGELLFGMWVYASVDNAATFHLGVFQNIPALGSLQNAQVSYLNPMEGKPPADIFSLVGGPGSTGVINQSGGNVTEYYWPKIGFGTFVKVPATYGLALWITTGASAASLQITWYGQFVTETDIHTGNPAAARA